MTMEDPVWIKEARKLIGLHEIKGRVHAAEILQFWKDIKRGGIKDDETAWCAAFTGAMLERAGVVSTRFEGATSYLQWGRPLVGPIHGCIGVLVRKGGGGHVGFVVGADNYGRLLLLAGNQDNAVTIRAFHFERFVGFRWPSEVPLPEQWPLEVYVADESRTEA